jgi:hypothetical protein
MKGTETAGPRRDEPRVDEYDRDLNVRRVVWAGVYLVVGTVAVFVLTWWMFLGLARLETRKDPAPPPLAEERQPQPLPPEPRLQASPDEDMVTLREREDRVLHEPAWIDRQAGLVRLPIDLAIDVIARRGIPAIGEGAPSPSQPPAPAAPVPPPPGSNPS